MKMYKWLVVVLCSTIMLACSNKEEENGSKKTIDTITQGEIKIAIDSDLKRVMEQQLHVFESSYPEAKLDAAFVPQELAIESLLVDSVRLAIVSRALSNEEKAYLEANKIKIQTMTMAIDAVAVIINNEAQDSFLTLDMLQSILLNNFTRKYNFVFDHSKSGIIKYINDKLIPKQSFPSNSYALHTIDSVIDYVSKNKNAMGFVPVSNLYDQSDLSKVGSFTKKVKLVAMKSDSLDEFFLPYQPNLFANHYPLTRPIYFHLRENYRGLGTGFVNFLCQERGQTIFYREKMLPTRIPIAYSRDTILK